MDSKTLKEVKLLLDTLTIQGTNNARILAEISIRVEKLLKETEDGINS